MTDATRYRVGMLGCGRAAVALHLPALQHVPGARVVALADSDANALDTAAGRFGVSSRHADIEGLLAAGVDVVAVCVPAAQHVDAALAVIESGKHLLVEKPLATDRGGCERLLAAAARSPARVTVGFNLRCRCPTSGNGSSSWTPSMRRRRRPARCRTATPPCVRCWPRSSPQTAAGL